MSSRYLAIGALALSLAVSAAAFTVLTPGVASAGTCTFGFGNQTGLALLWNGVAPNGQVFTGQAAGFMYPSCTRVQCGQQGACSTNPNLCAPAAGQTGCQPLNWGCEYNNNTPEQNQVWYFEPCSFNSEWFYFDENPGTNYGHFHIPPDDITILTRSSFCWATNPDRSSSWGQWNGSSCVPLNTTTISRNIVPHQPDEWMRVEDLSNSTTYFIPSGIYVESDSAEVKVAFIDDDNTWWQWNLVGTGQWTLNPTGSFGTIAYIGTLGPQNGHSEFNIDNFSVKTEF